MSSIMQDLQTIGLNPFAVTLLAESLLKSPVAPMTVGKPQGFFFPINRSDCAGWVGVRITVEAVRPACDCREGECESKADRDCRMALEVRAAAAKRLQSGSDTPPLATELTKPSTDESAAHPAAGEATERAGWKLVPIEPTEAMVDAGYEAIKEEHDRGVGNWGERGGHSWREPREAWKAMLAAVSGEATERGAS